MRQDKQVDSKLSRDETVWWKNYQNWRESSDPWKQRIYSAGDGAFSLSGGERDHLFLNLHGEQFADVAGVSGLDSPSDGRGLARWDLDRDGRQDLAVVNSNAPWVSLFHNQVAPASAAGMIAVRLVGGNQTARPDPAWSNRDGIGALVRVLVGGQWTIGELRAGEGFAAQNSATLIFGLGPLARADAVEVRWPSGRLQRIAGVAEGTLLTLYERPDSAPGGRGFERTNYRPGALGTASLAPRRSENPINPVDP